MRKKILFILLLFQASVSLAGDIVKIGVFTKSTIKAFILTTSTGAYDVVADGNVVTQLQKNGVLQVYLKDGKIGVKTFSDEVGEFGELYLKKRQWGSSFRIKTTIPNLEERQYYDDLIIKKKANAFKLINKVYIEHYVAGVVESEAGSKQSLEYYKVQSIICRTYALSKLSRHIEEEYNLCDRVHCQVYHSKSRFNADIPKATNATKGMVLVDSDINLITASFHSNCGGQTLNAEDVWKYPVPYLKSVCDTFCSGQRHSYWEKKIPTNSWLSYLSKKYNYPIQDSAHNSIALTHAPDYRIGFLSSDSLVRLTRLRKDWKLWSTYFSLEQQQDSVLLKGNGFGHGVGLCQEGAMKMADLGKSFTDILHFYYKDVHLVDLSALDFFREE